MRRKINHHKTRIKKKKQILESAFSHHSSHSHPSNLKHWITQSRAWHHADVTGLSTYTNLLRVIPCLWHTHNEYLMPESKGKPITIIVTIFCRQKIISKYCQDSGSRNLGKRWMWIRIIVFETRFQFKFYLIISVEITRYFEILQSHLNISSSIMSMNLCCHVSDLFVV